MMRPSIIVSPWNVIKLDSGNVLAAQSSLGATIGEWRLHAQLIGTVSQPLQLSVERKAQILLAVMHLRDTAAELGLVAAHDAGTDAYDYLMKAFAASHRYSPVDLGNFISQVDRLLFSFTSEVRAKLVLAMPSRHAEYYADASHFGDSVEDAFPSVGYDVAEAAKCRSLGRWTACVMHLMRVLETGLGALAAHLGITADGNWNTILNEIERKVRGIGKNTHGREAEQWAAEAGIHLRFIKNAWRNHAMHPLEKYDEERAVAIFENTRSFMQHLAARLSE